MLQGITGGIHYKFLSYYPTINFTHNDELDLHQQKVGKITNSNTELLELWQLRHQTKAVNLKYIKKNFNHNNE